MNSITHSFNILGKANREFFSDVSLVTECGSTVPAHKVVLGAVSARFSALFNKYPEKKDFPIRNVKIDTLIKVVDFIYNGKVNLTDNTELGDFWDCFSILNLYLGPKVSAIIKKLNDLNSDTSEKGSQESLHKCEDCDRSFMLKKQLTRHRRQVHKVEKKEKAVYKCINPECGEEYTVDIY